MLIVFHRWERETVSFITSVLLLFMVQPQHPIGYSQVQVL